MDGIADDYRDADTADDGSRKLPSRNGIPTRGCRRDGPSSSGRARFGTSGLRPSPSNAAGDRLVSESETGSARRQSDALTITPGRGEPGSAARGRERRPSPSGVGYPSQPVPSVYDRGSPAAIRSGRIPRAKVTETTAASDRRRRDRRNGASVPAPRSIESQPAVRYRHTRVIRR